MNATAIRRFWFVWRNDIGAGLWLVAFMVAVFVGLSFFEWTQRHG